MCYNLQLLKMQGFLTMIKYFLVLLAFTFTLSAKTIGAIALTVNGDPITLYEIETFAKRNHISKEDAVNALIQQKIEEEEIKKAGFYATPEEVDKRIAMIAKQNHMSLEQFEAALKKEGKTLESLRSDLEKQIKKEKLYQRILAGKMKKPDEEAMRAYYQKHKQEFTIPGKIKIQEYLSSDPRALQAIRMQPMLVLENVKITPRLIDPRKTNPQLVQLLLQTPSKSFTPIVNLGKNQAAMFFVEYKGRSKTAPFEQVKQQIMMRMLKEQEQANLIAYFEKKKSEADIQVIRKP
jgi:parvulin-like peptidyl-prolyl isomerase